MGKKSDYNCSDSQIAKENKLFLKIHAVGMEIKTGIGCNDPKQGVCDFNDSLKDLLPYEVRQRLNCNFA